MEAVGTGVAAALNATGSGTQMAAAETGFRFRRRARVPAGGMGRRVNRGGLTSLFDLVFGCWYKRCSFPITVRGTLRRSTAAASAIGTYVVRLDCGA